MQSIRPKWDAQLEPHATGARFYYSDKYKVEKPESSRDEIKQTKNHYSYVLVVFRSSLIQRWLKSGSSIFTCCDIDCFMSYMHEGG